MNKANIRKVDGGYIVETVIPAKTIKETVCADFDSLMQVLQTYYKETSSKDRWAFKHNTVLKQIKINNNYCGWFL